MSRKKKNCTSSRPVIAVLGIGLMTHALMATAVEPYEGLSSEDLFFNDIPIVLSATRLSQPVTDIPAAITIIDRELIEASGAVNIADLFRLVPGFQIGYFTGGKPTVTYHGKADRFARDMQVLIDGRSIYDPAFGGVTWLDQEVGIDDIQRIEVVRGPNAASYGSNSFSGVINIITYHPSEQEGTHVRTIVGKFGHRQVTARYAGTSGDLAYRMTAKYDQDDGFKTRVSDDSDTRWLSFRGDYQLNTRDSLMFELGGSKGNREDGFVDDGIQPPRNTEDTHHFQQIRWTRNLGDASEFYLQAYHNYQKIDDDFLNLLMPMDETGLPIDVPAGAFRLGYGFASHRYDIEFQHNSSLSNDLRLVWGAGARQDQATGIWTFNTNDWITRNQLRGFANLEWKATDKLIVNVGGMVEKFEDKSALFSPRIALNFKPSANHVFRLISTQAYRMPTLWEDFSDLSAIRTTYGEGIGIPFPTYPFYKNKINVDPEKIQSYEMGYLLNLPRYDLQLDVKGYKESVTQLISELKDTDDSDIYYYDNSGYYDVWGWEVELNWKPTPASLIHLAYNKAKSYGEYIKAYPAIKYKYLRNTATPEQTLSLLGSYRFNSGYIISGGFYYMDPVTWGGDGDRVSHNHRTDLYLAKEFTSHDYSGEVGILLQRFSDDHWDFYQQRNPSDTQANRWSDRVFLQLSLNWR